MYNREFKPVVNKNKRYNSKKHMIRHNSPKQQSPTLPLIWKTDIPNKLKEALSREDNPVIVVKAPTGYGKTILINHTLASINKENQKLQRKIKCYSLMPFRISVKEMHSYISRLFPDLHFGYAFKGENGLSPKNNCQLMTVGYWLESFLSRIKGTSLIDQDNSNEMSMERIIMVDEVHDSGWQTELALKIILWLRKNGWNIKLIVASATLNIQDTIEKHTDNYLLLATSEIEERNIEMNYLDHNIKMIMNGKMSDDVSKNIKKILDNDILIQEKGDVLIIMPGQDEISNLINIIIKDQRYQDYVVCPLHSQLSREDMVDALTKRTDGTNRIIISTNIVENAITIDGLLYVIDSGLRKENHIDPEGIQQLILTLASQANIIQSTGRCGRQGKRGKAFVMYNEESFNNLKCYGVNESERNPLYPQIIKLVSNGLPPFAILGHAREKIIADTKYLLKYDVFEIDEGVDYSDIIDQNMDDSTFGKLKITKYGQMISNLPLSIKAGYFLSKTLLNPHHTIEFNFCMYFACLVAVWIDTTNSLFYKSRNITEAKSLELEQKRSEVLGDDCLETMLNVWIQSWMGDFKKWCSEYGIFTRTLVDMNKNVIQVIKTLNRLEHHIDIPTTNWENVLENMDTLQTFLRLNLMETFSEWTFSRTYTSYKKTYCSSAHDTIYEINKFNINKTSTEYLMPPQKLIALELRKNSGYKVYLSKIVNLEG